MSIKKNELKNYIRDIPNFPKEGVVFKDITTLLSHPGAFKKSVDLLIKNFKNKKIDSIVAIEARGFIFGAVLAYKLGAGFIPVRKKGKLPYKKRSVTYDLEYGTDTLDIHEDAIKPSDNILVVDDLLATGGTARAVCDLIKGQDANIVGLAFLVELKFLKGKKKFNGIPIYSIIKY